LRKLAPLSKEGSGAVGRGPRGKTFTKRMNPFPFPLEWLYQRFGIFLAEKHKLRIYWNFQFSNFRLFSKTEKLSHARDCNIVGETK